MGNLHSSSPSLDRTIRRALIAATAFAIVIRLVFAWAASGVTVNGDESVNFLLSQYIAEGNTPLLFWTQPYQFPFEAYLLSLFADVLPWSPTGIRIIQIALCVSGALGFALLYRFIGPLRQTWPGLLLILFPSSYWLIRQVALMTPQHSAMVFFAALLLLCVAKSKAGSRTFLWTGLGGLIGGMMLSNHLLSLSLVVSCSLALCLSKSFRSALWSTSSFAIGFALGCSPYLYAKLFVPGAYQTVSETLPASAAIARVWNPVISDLIPTALGIDPWIFPDDAHKISTFAFLAPLISYLFCALLLSLSIIRLVKFVKRAAKHRWPVIELNDVFIATTWIALILLSLTKMDPRTRYALHIVWSFPFLISYAYAITPRKMKFAIGCLTVALVAINLTVSAELFGFWSAPNFSKKYANLPPLTPLLKNFKKNGVSHCYAGWWLAYRINVETQGEFICSPPFNDRFREWEQPYYRQSVDLKDNTPYVVGVYTHRFLRGQALDVNLKKHGFVFDKIKAGAFKVYSNFRHPVAEHSHVVSSNSYTVKSSQTDKLIPALSDGDLETMWEATYQSQQLPSLEVSLADRKVIHAIRLFSPTKVIENDAPWLNISSRKADGSWKLLVSGLPGTPHLLKLDKNYDRYHYRGLELSFGFEPVETDQLRIEVNTPSKGTGWQLSEIHLFDSKT